MIQIAAAFHHFQRKNFIGTASLLREALRRLELFPAAYGGIEVEVLRESIRGWLEALGRDEQFVELPIPLIR